MTNSWNDIANTDVMLIIGANPAENHPCGFKWAIEARRLRNARMLVVDPRFTRTAATADLHVPIRAGSDIAFVGGLIRYVIENDLYAHDYVLNYTNASFIVNKDFHCADEGLFSGFDAVHSHYDRTTWNYQAKPVEHAICSFRMGKDALHFLNRVASLSLLTALRKLNPQLTCDVLPRNG